MSEFDAPKPIEEIEEQEAFLATEEELPSPKKVELKKQAPFGLHQSHFPTEEQASIPETKEAAVNTSQVEVEIDFILDRKRISLRELSVLAKGEIITLSGNEFKATLFLQEKAIAEAELIMVDQRPSLQITKTF
jgi:flagellar motor switch/type III secretory pathway protein FliN